MKKRPCAEVLALGSAQLKPCTAKCYNHSYKTLSFSGKVLFFFFVSCEIRQKLPKHAGILSEK